MKPNHIAIIPDGNRRWAEDRHLPTIEGHRRGFDNAIKIAKITRDLGVSTLTLWAFSTENWDRTKEEVGYLMKLFEILIDKNLTEAMRDHVRITHIGRKDRIPKGLLKKIEESEQKTAHFDEYYLNIALDYGGRDEIVRAANKVLSIKNEVLSIKENDITDNLDLTHQPYPNPDMIVRTGREMRLSGFMLWQSQYSELFFPEVYFPDFTGVVLEKLIAEYEERQRRFGK